MFFSEINFSELRKNIQCYRSKIFYNYILKILVHILVSTNILHYVPRNLVQTFLIFLKLFNNPHLQTVIKNSTNPQSLIQFLQRICLQNSDSFSIFKYKHSFLFLYRIFYFLQKPWIQSSLKFLLFQIRW